MTKPLPKNILVIGDTHEPFCRKGYLEFCQRTRDKYECDTIVHVGDEVDSHMLSTHPHDSSGYSAGHEYVEALKKMKLWYAAFPEMKVCIGNHTERHFRRATDIGLPYAFLKTYRDVWEAPKSWLWEYEWNINGIVFMHGTGHSGDYPHANLAKHNRQSTVIGHCHSVSGVHWLASKHDLIFGMAVGCGMDTDSYAAKYAISCPKKPIISCGVILDRGKTPFIVKMEI